MKRTIIILTFLIYIFNLSAQTKDKIIENIKTHFKWINKQNDFKIIDLNNLDFLEHPTDNGASLQAFYKDTFLYKIVETIGLSNGIVTSEYYLWNNKLFFVYYTEKSFKEVYDKDNNFVEFDYTKTETKYEERHYYNNDKEIKYLETGEKIMNKTDYDFLKSTKNFKTILDNKKKYNSEYQKLQGNWISTEDKLYSIEFDGLIRIDYYDGELGSTYRIKINERKLICTDLDNGDEYKYDILNLTDKNLSLQYLPRGNKLFFKRK